MPSLDARRTAPHPAPAAPARTGRLRGGALLVLAGAVAATTACGGEDPFAVRASLETTLDTMVVFPLSGAQPLLPSAIDLFGRSVVRPALRGGVVSNFDIALDVDAQGRVLLYPASLVASPPGGSPRTGFQVVTGAFDALESAPRDGYRFDTLQVATVGQVLAIEGQGVSQTGIYCGTASPMHAKLVIDSVSRVTGAAHLRVRTNPNCGFRSLKAGLPDD
ncbi:MAG: hypothetical protein ACXWZS_07445 [Gemmatirosa sp.]